MYHTFRAAEYTGRKGHKTNLHGDVCQLEGGTWRKYSNIPVEIKHNGDGTQAYLSHSIETKVSV